MQTTAAEFLPPCPADDDVVGQANFNRSFNDFKGDVSDSVYPVTLSEIETFEGPDGFNPGKTRKQIVWKFTIDGQEEKGALAYFTSFSMHEKSKLPGLCVALGKSGPTESNPGISRSYFLGSKCKALVETLPSKKDPTKSYPRITRLIKA